MSDLISRIHVDEGKIIVQSSQDCEPIMESAKRLARETGGQSRGSDLRHVARLPKVIIEKYCNDNGVTFQEWLTNPVHVERMLGDHDLAYFRVAP